MTITTHATLGAVIGAATGNIWIAFLVGFGSHFLIDILPHGDREMYENYKSRKAQSRATKFVMLDALIAVVVIALMFGFSSHAINAVISAGIIGSVIPDIIVVVQETWKIKPLKWFRDMHFWFHNMISDRYGDIKLKHAILAQIAIVIALQGYF